MTQLQFIVHALVNNIPVFLTEEAFKDLEKNKWSIPDDQKENGVKLRRLEDDGTIGIILWDGSIVDECPINYIVCPIDIAPDPRKETAMIGAIIADHYMRHVYHHSQGYIDCVDTVGKWSVEFYDKYKDTDWEDVLNNPNSDFPDANCWDDFVIAFAQAKMKDALIGTPPLAITNKTTSMLMVGDSEMTLGRFLNFYYYRTDAIEDKDHVISEWEATQVSMMSVNQELYMNDGIDKVIKITRLS